MVERAYNVSYLPIIWVNMNSNNGNNSCFKNIVCHHDLLGFGGMISAAGGTLDSAVGRVALSRISSLRKRFGEIAKYYPEGSKFYHLNDSAIVVCDVDYRLNRFHNTDGSLLQEGDSITDSEYRKCMQFIGASAMLHRSTEEDEESIKSGPGGRTILVYGDRWEVPACEDEVLNVDKLQANVAFAEATKADSAGSRSGLKRKAMYVNDRLSAIISSSDSDSSIYNEICEYLKKNNMHRSGDSLKELVFFPSEDNVNLEIFFRETCFCRANDGICICLLYTSPSPRDS